MCSIRRLRPLLGTFVEVGVHGEGGVAETAVETAFGIVAQVHRRLSFQDPNSELSRLNRAGCQPVRLHPTTLRLVRLAQATTKASGGLFNCTVGGALVRRGVLPDHGFGVRLERGDAADIELRPGTAQLRRPVLLTLDGIAKGYAVDLAIAAMRRCGASAGWVNAGGDLRVFGNLTLPVQRREADGRLTNLGGLRESAVASSRIARDLDPDFPGVVVPGTAHTEAHVGVWTVLAQSAWRADALTKVACLAPTARRDLLIRRLGGRLVGAIPAEGVAA